MVSPLLELLSPEQQSLLTVLYDHFGTTGTWPVWQYADLTLEGDGLDAANILASLPAIGDQSPVGLSYGLTWRMDPHLQPRPDARVAVTVAGLRHVPDAQPLLGAFIAMVRHLIVRQRKLAPSPERVVEATVTSREIADEIVSASVTGNINRDFTLSTGHLRALLREVLSHEPFFHPALNQPNSQDWEIKVPAVLRAYRSVETVADYIERVTEQVSPRTEPSVPLSSSSLDIPYAVGYLDAVWKNRTNSHLFANLDPSSIARLTQPCGSEEEFNSLMSALADVLGRAVVPGRMTPPQGGALEAVRDYLIPILSADAADRTSSAIGTLITLRHVRVNAQHSDKRHRAVETFQKIGLPFPPGSWAYAWSHIAATAKGALDALREEVHAELAGPSGSGGI